MEEKVCIVGAGKLGGSLARALCEAGVNVVAIADQNFSHAVDKAKMCGDETFAVTMEQIPHDLTIIMIPVPDDAIVKVANYLASTDIINQTCVVAHTSGALPAEILSVLKSKTKLLASFHPVQTFSGLEDDWQRLFGIHFGLEGNQDALSRLGVLVKKLRGREVRIPVDKKEFYHLSCVIASNFLVALQFAATKVLTQIGVSEEKAIAILEPMVYATLDNINIIGDIGALTGPIARGDIGTIKRHLNALEHTLPDLVPLYTTMSLLSLNLLRNKEGVDDNKLSEIKKQLEVFYMSMK